MNFKTENLCKRFSDGHYALRDISFTAKEGQSIAIIGPNGAGKSTLIKCLVGLEEITSGSISFGQVEISNMNKKNLRELRKNIGFVFQNFNLIQNLSVFHNVLFGTMGRKANPLSWFPLTASKEDRELVMFHLDRVGLADHAKKRVDHLSGGQQQRVAIAKMLMQKPKMIIADEPVASLDPKSGLEVIELLSTISREESLTVISILHQLDFARNYFDRIIGLKKGQIEMDKLTSNVSKENLDLIYSNPLEEIIV
ncbi:phosphonate ABC transporter ATP-binding protein [Gracilibacillus sp. YIM 98692]|uniref:phosphonate ABC transporter ATP-binding protein n=1 Tax=Gracilibacillus sp. YIM 98692 TaxID=2663532 RepID=UPI0013D4FA9B|nr:phosphonate ABC transporter ATP-binding protein [Gracilibacillus sp. YIM 98692]